MYTDEDYLDELLKSIEPITKQNEEPEPEPEIETIAVPQVDSSANYDENNILAVQEQNVVENIGSTPESMVQSMVESIGQPVSEPVAQTMVQPTVEPASKRHASIDDEIDLSSFGWGGSEGGDGEQEADLDMGMSEAEIDALINAAKNAPIPPETEVETSLEDLFTNVGSMETLFGNASDDNATAMDALFTDTNAATMDTLFADADATAMDALFTDTNAATMDTLFADADTSAMDMLFTDTNAATMDTLFADADTSAMDMLFTDTNAATMDTLFADADTSAMDTLFTDTNVATMDTLFADADTSAMDTLFTETDNSTMDMLFADGSADNMETISTNMGGEQDDMAALLSQFKDDSDLSDIMNILEKDEKNEALDESLLSAYESAAENVLDLAKEDAEGTIPEKGEKKGFFKKKEKKEKVKKEKVKKEKVKKEKKSKKKDIEETAGAIPELADAVGAELLFEGVDEIDTIKEKKVKKQGLFSKILQVLTEEEEEPVKKGDVPEADATGITDENLAILNELSDEDKKKKIKADKKNKKGKKNKKDGKGNKDDKEDKDERGRRSDKDSDDSDGEENENKKDKKKKKEKKPKKMKVMELEVPAKKIPRKYIIAVFVFCLTIMALILIVSTLYTSFSNLKSARWAFDNEDYQTCYENLYGEKLGEKDQLLFDKSAVILSMQRKLDSYENFRQLGMDVEALNSLFEGVLLYDRLIEKAHELNVAPKVEKIYQTIRGKFSDFGVTEEMVEEILAYESAATYTRRLQSIVNGTPFEEIPSDGTQETEEISTIENQEPLEDILEEEMDFLPDDTVGIFSNESDTE